MKNIKLADAQSALQAIANQKGRAGYERAKSAFLDDKIIVDDAEAPIAEVKFEEPTFAEVEKATGATVIGADSPDLAKLVSEQVTKALASARSDTQRPRVSIESGTEDRRKGVIRGRTQFIKSSGDWRKDAEMAHDFGRWLQAITFGDRARSAVEHCRRKGFGVEWGEFDENDRFVQKSITGHSESVNVDGGFLVPPEFDNEILWLREQYGVVRRRARRKPMMRDTLSYSRKTGSHTAYYVAEGGTGTTSKMAFDRITLVAKKLRIDGYLTSDLSEDAAVNLGDEAVQDIAETFAKKEDTDAFTGNGTSTYGGIMGFCNAFLALSGTLANIAGLYDAAQASYAAVTITDVLAWMAKLPAYADNANTAFYCHKVFYVNVLQRLEVSAGGVTMTELVNGQPVHRFMGYPVEFVQALPMSPTANTPDAFFGDMTKAADFGERRGVTFRTTDVGGNAWANDEVAYKASQRWDFQIHDIGNASASAASQVAGPIVAIVAT